MKSTILKFLYSLLVGRFASVQGFTLTVLAHVLAHVLAFVVVVGKERLKD
jgi:hypothetical protein